MKECKKQIGWRIFLLVLYIQSVVILALSAPANLCLGSLINLHGSETPESII